MTSLIVQNIGSDRDVRLAVDSRLIAEVLGVGHSDWMQNVLKKYLAEIEKDFGVIDFQNGKLRQECRPTAYAFLTEDQACCLMTYSRNTDQVRAAKRGLVKAFSEAKALNHAILDPLVRSLLQSLTFNPSSTQGYVYALADVANNRIKIGVTKNLEQRLAQLQCGDTQTLLFSGVRAFETMQEAMDGEREIHEALKNWRYSGEWFEGVASETAFYANFFSHPSRVFKLKGSAS